jgi:uncharacterized protein
MTLLRVSIVAFLLSSPCFECFAQDDSKPVLMSKTGGNSWSDVKELEKDVTAGKPGAFAAYGEMLVTGDQVAKDVPRGIGLLEKAVQAGQKNAAFRLGKLYEDGELAPRDYAKAMEFYKKAAMAGVAEAQYNLGAMYVSQRGTKRDYKEGLAWMIVATKSGAAPEGEQQVRQRLLATKRDSVITAAEQRAAELEKEIQASLAALDAQKPSATAAKATLP